MNKRTAHFIQNPPYFGIRCEKCKGINLLWSEFESCYWCNYCELDIECNPKYDIFPVEACRLMGFDLRKWDIVNKCIIESI